MSVRAAGRADCRAGREAAAIAECGRRGRGAPVRRTDPTRKFVPSGHNLQVLRHLVEAAEQRLAVHQACADVAAGEIRAQSGWAART
jgi:hypothetical protein